MTDESVTIKRTTYKKLVVGLVIVLIAFSFTAGYLLGSISATGAVTAEGGQPSQAAPTVAPQQPSQPAAGRISVSLDNDPRIGNPDAGVVMIEFSDFQCPFCGRFFTQTLPQVKQDYVDTGKILFVYRDFPLDSIHPQATPAAIAAECANEQGKFWEFHDKLFENQQLLGSDNYKQWAADLGLNTDQFNSCFDSGKYADEVRSDFQDGVAATVSGTPTFFIGNPEKGYTKVVGAQPYSVIKSVIDAELSA